MGRKNKRKDADTRISYCICPECHNEFPIPRIKYQREKNHPKDLYCPTCNRVVTMREIRAFEAYKNMLGEEIETAFNAGV